MEGNKKKTKYRSHGDGGITQYGPNRFRLRYDGPTNPDGSRNQLSEMFRGTKTEALSTLRERQQHRDGGLFVTPQKITVSTYMSDWLERHSANVAPKTTEGYASMIRNYIKPSLGHVPLQRLEPVNIADMYLELKERGLSSSTIGHTHRTLTKSLGDALKLRLLKVNPVLSVSPPRQQRKQPDMWTTEQFKTFLRVAEENEFRDFFELAALTGMRRSEIAGLNWDNVELVKANLRVVGNLQRITGSGLVEGRPKSSSSRRNIALSRRGVELLKKVQRESLERQLAAGEAWKASGYVFTDEAGRPYDSGRATKEFKKLAGSAALPPLSLHSLRHLHASLLLMSGTHVKVVSERLGHSSVAFTMDVYGHLMPGMQEQAAKLIDEALA
jgi:integrase